MNDDRIDAPPADHRSETRRVRARSPSSTPDGPPNRVVPVWIATRAIYRASARPRSRIGGRAASERLENAQTPRIGRFCSDNSGRWSLEPLDLDAVHGRPIDDRTQPCHSERGASEPLSGVRPDWRRCPHQTENNGFCVQMCPPTITSVRRSRCLLGPVTNIEAQMNDWAVVDGVLFDVSASGHNRSAGTTAQ